ncbi:hypothetical protein IGI04_016258 [Brassica rapa subsp. trilocularis]|uniref:Homeobox domain-containing protein n=1 Tax=Brassica rapa subsp. trilocularis TaxID=1813537 RepID=A0ABQ7MUX3_BRACM|nr:hypothetical protein IGI04_016258 [Brassica rapa subsp. trilocularis]
MSPVAATRWCPTPEQLMILEEMYRSGIRTPNAVQIQQITAHLAFYGRIEGKNAIGVEAQSKVLSEHYCNKSGREDMLMQKPITGQNTSYGRDWMMMMMDMGPRPSYPSSSSVPVPYCNMMMNSPKIPLKTLELFPISSINSKQDSSKL